MRYLVVEMRRYTTKKKKIVIAVTSVVAGLVVVGGALSIACINNPGFFYWLTGNPATDWRTEYMIEGTFKTIPGTETSLENTYTLELHPIDEQSFNASNGVNVLQDFSNDYVRQHDYWSIILTQTNETTHFSQEITLVGMHDEKPGAKRAQSAYLNEDGSIRLLRNHEFSYSIYFPTGEYFEPGIKDCMGSYLFLGPVA